MVTGQTNPPHNFILLGAMGVTTMTKTTTGRQHQRRNWQLEVGEVEVEAAQLEHHREGKRPSRPRRGVAERRLLRMKMRKRWR
jgi:hypothetical protein